MSFEGSEEKKLSNLNFVEELQVRASLREEKSGKY
jgi:hypothetical protein